MHTSDPAFLQVISEAAPDGLLVADEGGRILVVNGQLEALFGYPRDELIGMPIEMLIPERFRGGHIMHVQGFGHHPSRRPMGTGLDLQGRRRDGSEFPVEISLSPVATEEGLIVIAAIRDITDRRLLEEGRRRAEERYRLLAEQAQDIVFRVRLMPPPARIEYISPAVMRLTGYTPEDHYADPTLLVRMVHADDRPRMEELLRDPTAVPMPLLLRVLPRGRMADAPTWLELNCTVLTDGWQRSTAVEGMARDVTQRVAAETERQQLLVQTEMQQDRERIARDLHDGVMQALYGAGLNLQAVLPLLHDDQVDAGAAIEDTVGSLRGAITDIRAYVMDLRTEEVPARLEEVVVGLAAEVRAQGLLDVVVDLPGELPQLTGDQQAALSHIVREAVSNVRRHAHAHRIRIEVSMRRSTLTVLVEDDGDGFDVASRAGSDHMGLGNMESRALAIGAELTIDSSRGHGTRVRCALPLR